MASTAWAQSFSRRQHSNTGESPTQLSLKYAVSPILLKDAASRIDMNPDLCRLGIAFLDLLQHRESGCPPIEGRDNNRYRDYACHLRVYLTARGQQRP